MNLKQIELFRYIMEYGTLTQAAEMLSVSQPAASNMLMQLERSTGLVLFQRVKGRLKSTREGELYFAEVQRTWRSIERLEQMTKDIRELQFGRLNLGVMPSLAGTLVPPLLTQFCQKHEKTAVTLHSRTSDQIVQWAVAGQIDLGITEMPTAHPNVVSRVIARIPCVCVIPERHHLASRSDIRPEDIDDENFVSVGTIERLMLAETIFDQAGARPRMLVEAPMANVACAIVASGGGVALVDEISARSFEGRGLVAKPFTPRISVPIWHLRPNTLSGFSLAEAFMHDVENAFERLNYRADI